MENTYLTQIIVSVGIFIILCFLGERIKKILLDYINKNFDIHDYLPIEEILSLKQVYYLILILAIYICIINFFFDKFFTVSAELFLINSILDIFIAIYIIVTSYDCTTRTRLISIFLMPLASISALVFGGTFLGYWNLVRIPTLLYLVIHYYNKFLEFTDRNNLGKLILIMISIIFISLILTIFFERQNPINSLGMVSNAFTSNGYAVLGSTLGGVLTSTFLVWSGYIISGVATATLTASIVQRNAKKKLENLEEKIDNLEKLLTENQKNSSKEKEE